MEQDEFQPQRAVKLSWPYLGNCWWPPMRYQSREEIRKGDKVLFHGESGEIELVVDKLVGDPALQQPADAGPVSPVVLLPWTTESNLSSLDSLTEIPKEWCDVNQIVCYVR
jgi:hypothetical protein